MFASRTGWQLKPNRLSLALSGLLEKKAAILDLTESNLTRCGFRPGKEEDLRILADGKNRLYEPSPKGLRAAREAVARYYGEKGVPVSPESVFLTASTSEAYSFLMRLLVNAGENILVPKPSYPLFDFLADINDCRLYPYPLLYDGEWIADFYRINVAADIGTKALVTVTPNNPTGSFLKKKELADFNGFAKERDIALISDEVFSDYAFETDKNRAGTLAGNTEALTFTLSGISKVLGLPQMKLGWIVVSGPENRVAKAVARLEIIADTFLSVNTPAQNALECWLRDRESVQAPIRARTAENLSFLRQQFEKPHSAELLNVEGGWYATLRLPRTQTEEAWCLEFLEKDLTHVHPGYFFDFHDEAYIVVSLLALPQVFREGVTRILQRIG